MLTIVKIWPIDPETVSYGGYRAIELSDGSFAWSLPGDPRTLGATWTQQTWRNCSSIDPLYKYIAGKVTGAVSAVVKEGCKYNQYKLPQFAEEFNYWYGDLERGLPQQAIAQMTAMQRRVLRNLRELPLCGYSDKPVIVQIKSKLLRHETLTPVLHCVECWG